MKKILILAALLVFPSLMFPSQAQAITDVPGCGEYFYGWSYSAAGTWNPTYATWCGSDEWGYWYNVDQWCQVSGICYRDYGYTHE
jgi:hypothetical protein